MTNKLSIATFYNMFIKFYIKFRLLYYIAVINSIFILLYSTAYSFDDKSSILINGIHDNNEIGFRDNFFKIDNRLYLLLRSLVFTKDGSPCWSTYLFSTIYGDNKWELVKQIPGNAYYLENCKYGQIASTSINNDNKTYLVSFYDINGHEKSKIYMNYKTKKTERYRCAPIPFIYNDGTIILAAQIYEEGNKGPLGYILSPIFNLLFDPYISIEINIIPESKRFNNPYYVLVLVDTKYRPIIVPINSLLAEQLDKFDGMQLFKEKIDEKGTKLYKYILFNKNEYFLSANNNIFKINKSGEICQIRNSGIYKINVLPTIPEKLGVNDKSNILDINHQMVFGISEIGKNFIISTHSSINSFGSIFSFLYDGNKLRAARIDPTDNETWYITNIVSFIDSKYMYFAIYNNPRCQIIKISTDCIKSNEELIEMKSNYDDIITLPEFNKKICK